MYLKKEFKRKTNTSLLLGACITGITFDINFIIVTRVSLVHVSIIVNNLVSIIATLFEKEFNSILTAHYIEYNPIEYKTIIDLQTNLINIQFCIQCIQVCLSFRMRSLFIAMTIIIIKGRI